MKPLKIKKPVIVEGKYDRQRLAEVMTGTVITTDGFGIFNKKEKMALIRRLAKNDGIIVLTDSDGAGGVIRSHITSSVPAGSVTQLYIPKIKGKEKRKHTPSKEGTLGVEGIDIEKLYELLRPFSDDAETVAGDPVTKADMYALGMSGMDGAEARRNAMALSLDLPDGMTPNAFLAAVNVLLTRDEFIEKSREIIEKSGI